jgi:hypothetical protein
MIISLPPDKLGTFMLGSFTAIMFTKWIDYDTVVKK